MTLRTVPICRRRRSASRAFTLLELLVALMISGIVLVSLFSAMFVTFRSREYSMAAVEPTGSTELAMEMIRADLQAAQPPSATGVMLGPFYGVQGGGNGGDTLTFYTNGYGLQHQSGNSEIKQVYLTIDQRNNTQVLLRQVIPNTLAQQLPTPDEEVICRYVTGFTLQYYDGVQWETSWDSTQYNNALPAAIEVTLTIHPPSAKAPI